MQILVPGSTVGTSAPSSHVEFEFTPVPCQGKLPLPTLLPQALNESLGMEEEREREDRVREREQGNPPQDSALRGY